MQHEIALVLLHFVVLYNNYNFVNGKALIGNIKSVNEGQYSFVVCIAEYEDEAKKVEVVICTGSLLSLQHVLTSEHCFEEIGNDEFHVIAGSNKLRKSKRYKTAWWISFAKWASSVNKKPKYLTNDIAIVKLSKSIGERVSLASLSTVERFDTTLKINFEILGWDKLNDKKASELKMANVQMLSDAECGAMASRILNSPVQVHEKYFCTKAEPYSLITDGDSGGPILYEGKIVALNKGQFPGEHSNRFSEVANVHLYISNYLEFISAILAM